VNAPSNIQGTYEMAIANFGVPLYGAVLNGALAYPPVDHEACDPYPADWRAPKHPGLGASVVVVDRGDCAFTRKAFHAQQAGADAVMIHDNVAETLVTMDAASDAQARSYFYTGPDTTTFAWCTPILKDYLSRRISPPRVPRFQSRHNSTSTPFNAASDAFELHPDVALNDGTTLSTRQTSPSRWRSSRNRWATSSRASSRRGTTSS
jgi:hypothetical protein